ncbi:MAG: hypothetical protein IJF78_15360 [Clostridia bacterium]|nr:hypothetical protein [Clostridia bacterium]
MNDPQHPIKTSSVSICGMHLHYFLYETELPSQNRKSYSIQIRKESFDDSEEAWAYDITSLHPRAVEIYRLIVSGTVTPCTLTDILEDLL